MATLTLKGLYFTPFQSSLWFRITLVTIKTIFLLLFCLNWEYVCIVKTNGVRKGLSIANVFHSSNIWFHSSGVWRTTSEEKMFSHMHIHTHIFECPRILPWIQAILNATVEHTQVSYDRYSFCDLLLVLLEPHLQSCFETKVLSVNILTSKPPESLLSSCNLEPHLQYTSISRFCETEESNIIYVLLLFIFFCYLFFAVIYLFFHIKAFEVKIDIFIFLR